MARNRLDQTSTKKGKHLIKVENHTLDSLRDKRFEFAQQVEDLKRSCPQQTEVEPELTEIVIKSIDSMAPRIGKMKSISWQVSASKNIHTRVCVSNY